MDNLPAQVRLTTIEDRVDEAITERRTKMGKIVVSENVSLDGVVQDPRGRMTWEYGRSPSRCCSPPRFMRCRSVCASMALFTGAIAVGCVSLHGIAAGIVPMMLLRRLRRG
jgi:hypothetical protein